MPTSPGNGVLGEDEFRHGRAGPMIMYSDYHNEVFYDLLPRHRRRIEEVLYVTPKVLRQQHFLPRLPSVGWVCGEVAWAICWDYLKAIEREMAEVLGGHSVFFWLHLYRRIGVRLGAGHADKIDPATVGLVRQIAELAITKFGDLSKTDDLIVSDQAKFHEILGGHYKRVLQRLFGKRGEAMKRFLALHAAPQWVATDFGPADLVGVFANEGLAYEYWRVTALMRAIGKGAEITRSEDDWIDYKSNSDLGLLIKSYDFRGRTHSGATLAGTWFGQLRSKGLGSWMLLPYYNIDRLGMEDGIYLPGVRLPTKNFFRPNFVMHAMDTAIFLDANSALAAPFRRQRGYGLESLLIALWGVANTVLVPARILHSESAELPDYVGPQGAFTSNMLNLMQRGYGTFRFGEGAAEEILYRAQFFEAPFAPIDGEEIVACVRDLGLTAHKQRDISLWSGGPRYPIIPFGPVCSILDLVSIAPVLRTLFVHVRHDGTSRGTAFEKEFRSALRDAGFPVERAGTLEAHDGQKREVDASVRLGARLYLFECVSIERPLDFEIGRIVTIDRRTSDLEAKLDQVLSLRAFILTKPDGRNYDFRWAEDLRAFVVSPFVEWVWSRSKRLWDGPRPRVVSAEEAIEFLRVEFCGLGWVDLRLNLLCASEYLYFATFSFGAHTSPPSKAEMSTLTAEMFAFTRDPTV